MKTILLFTLVILAVAISGCQDKKKVRNTNTQKEAVKVETKAVLIKDTIQVTETKTVTETTVVKEAPEYLLVGGCFRIKDNADRMYEKLHKEGYLSLIHISFYPHAIVPVQTSGQKTPPLPEIAKAKHLY